MISACVTDWGGMNMDEWLNTILRARLVRIERKASARVSSRHWDYSCCVLNFASLQTG